MRHGSEVSNETRGSALWGKRSGGQKGNTVWGRSGRLVVAAFLIAAALLSTASASASPRPARECGTGLSAYVPSNLVAAACANPSARFRVIVQGNGTTADVRTRVRRHGVTVQRSFRSIPGVSARVPGAALIALAQNEAIFAVTADAPVHLSDYQDAEMWRESTHVDSLWTTLDALTGLEGPAPQAPAIAVVDSGIDETNLTSFGTRVVANVTISSLAPGATGDGQGHGTMVAGVAAGADPLVPGVAQNAPIVSIRTSDDHGQSMTSDVVAAADWILANRDAYDIRVANFSLSGSTQVSFRYDPLNKAVERLWFDGVVVVAAAGNHGAETGEDVMSYAPANDPFVITVGALDQSSTNDPLDDFAAPWSAHGYTMDGFYKPDLSAPGRYMIMPVPETATIPATFPERVVAPGYMWMSGTSFSAPVVAGAAAQLLARHPEWTPDQVKGALMVTAVYLGNYEAGVGQIDAAAAAALEHPPNPNENLQAFVEPDATTGEPVFNEASWARYVDELTASGASWASANWSSASWARASWGAASWASASWARVTETASTDSTMSSAASLAE